MQFQFFDMIENGIEPIKVKQRIFTKNWLEQMRNDGFKLAVDQNNYVIYYQIFKKLPHLVNANHVFFAIVIAKNEKVNFYDDEIEQEIRHIMMKEEHQHKIKKHLILQFKKFDQLDEASKDEIEQIINFKNGDYHIIHITVGFFPEDQKVYFLAPKKKYPNKYYYYMCQQIYRYIGIKVEN